MVGHQRALRVLEGSSLSKPRVSDGNTLHREKEGGGLMYSGYVLFNALSVRKTRKLTSADSFLFEALP